MEPAANQFPQSLGGFKNRNIELPSTQKRFSDAALAGHKVTKVSSNVKVIEPRGGAIQPISKESYNKQSTDLTNMRKSGEAAKYDAEVRKSEKPAEKKTIKVRSN